MAEPKKIAIGTSSLVSDIFFKIKHKGMNPDDVDFLKKCRFIAERKSYDCNPDIAFIYITRNPHGIVTDHAVYEYAGFNTKTQILSPSYKCKAFGLKGGVTELSKRTGVCVNTLSLLFKTKPIVFHSYLEFALRSRGIV